MPAVRLVDPSTPFDGRTPYDPGGPEPVVCPATSIPRDGVVIDFDRPCSSVLPLSPGADGTRTRAVAMGTG